MTVTFLIPDQSGKPKKKIFEDVTSCDAGRYGIHIFQLDGKQTLNWFIPFDEVKSVRISHL